MGKRAPGASYSGVQWLDVSQSLEDYQRTHEGTYSLIELTPNGLGAFRLYVKLWYLLGREVFMSETVEYWRPASGRLEAFVYRSVIDTMKEVDRQIAAYAAKDQKVT